MNAPVEFFLSPSSPWLRRLKEYVNLKLYKKHCVLSVNWKLYGYLMRLCGNDLARLVSLFIVFSGSDDRVTLFSESDMAKFLGVSFSTARGYVAKYKDRVFRVLAAEHASSVRQFLEHKSDHIEFNSYELLEGFFEGFGEVPGVSRWDTQVRFKVGYKGLDLEGYFIECYKKGFIYKNNVYINSTAPSTDLPYYTGKNNPQRIDNQPNETVFFEHFKNPIYEAGFDETETPYPCNWPRHPDARAFFKKGRWYGGAIHCSKKGDERASYLEPLGLAHELDMHNAMFYFMLALLPETVSEADKTAYYGLVKSGRLYDDAVDMLPGASREEIKEKFQRYRNSKGGNKKRIKDIDLYFMQRFPTVRDWMLGQKQMQNRLAWIETDFMSRVCEKLSAGNIRYEWLHDAVYVSEDSSPAAAEIWNSVKGEFESVFVKKAVRPLNMSWFNL